MAGHYIAEYAIPREKSTHNKLKGVAHARRRKNSITSGMVQNTQLNCMVWIPSIYPMEVDENPVALLASCNTCKPFVAWPVYVRVHDLNCLSLSYLFTSSWRLKIAGCENRLGNMYLLGERWSKPKITYWTARQLCASSFARDSFLFLKIPNAVGQAVSSGQSPLLLPLKSSDAYPVCSMLEYLPTSALKNHPVS